MPGWCASASGATREGSIASSGRPQEPSRRRYPSAICCHPDARMDPHDRGATVASVLMDLDERRIWLADGHPCTTPYRELEVGELLRKPSPVKEDMPA